MIEMKPTPPIWFVLPILLAGLLVACSQGEEIPEPEIKQLSYTIGPEASVLEFNNLVLEIPAGALREETQVVFGYTDICNMERDVYLFRCPAISINPASLVFEKPVRLSMRENLFWLDNETAFDVDPLNSAMYNVSKHSTAVEKVEDALVRISGDEVVVSGEIWELGTYQLGMEKQDWSPDWSFTRVELVNDSLDIEIAYTIESNRESSYTAGFASYLPGYLQDSFYLNLISRDDWQELSFALNIIAVDSLGTFRKPLNGQEYILSSYPSTSGHRILASNALGEVGELTITRFDRPEGRIEGSYRGPGMLMILDGGSGSWEIELRAEFSFAFNQ